MFLKVKMKDINNFCGKSSANDIYAYGPACVCVCICVCVCVRALMRARFCMCVRAFVRAFICAFLRACACLKKTGVLSPAQAMIAR